MQASLHTPGFFSCYSILKGVCVCDVILQSHKALIPGHQYQKLASALKSPSASSLPPGTSVFLQVVEQAETVTSSEVCSAP